MNAMAHVWGSSDNLVGLIFLLLPCGSWDWNLSDLVASTHPLGHLAGPNFFFLNLVNQKMMVIDGGGAFEMSFAFSSINLYL